MGKPIWVRFSEFKVRNNLSNRKMAEIANQYAYSSSECARTVFTKNFGISEHVFYKVLDFAIIAKLVDKETQDHIFLKRIGNNCKHGSKEGAQKSVEHKNKVLQLQQEYAVAFEQHIASFSEADIFQICKEFGRDGLSIFEIAKRHNTSSRVIETLLKKGIGVLFDTYILTKRRLGE